MLWNHLANTDLPDVEWILVSDFNNIEQASDKQGGSTKTSIGCRELEAWNRLLLKLGVRDVFHLRTFHKRSEKAFTWSNAHSGNTMIQSRIERTYIPTRIEYIGGTTEILPTLPDISDHAGVVTHFNDKGKWKPSPPSFNKGLLSNQDTKTTLLTTWKTCMEDPDLATWNVKMVAANQAVLQKLAELTKQQRQKWKEMYMSQFDDIISAEAELQRNWGSWEARKKLSEAQATLHEVRQQKFQCQESAILSKWAWVGDRCTKGFFEHHAGHKKPTPITQLLDGDRIIDTQRELE